MKKYKKIKLKFQFSFSLFSCCVLCCVLGGAGFLGQHIVRLIEERDPSVKEIRIVDLKPYENRLGKQKTKPTAQKNQKKKETELIVKHTKNEQTNTHRHLKY